MSISAIFLKKNRTVGKPLSGSKMQAEKPWLILVTCARSGFAKNWFLRPFGTIDLLANIAAFQNTHEELEEFTTEEFDRTFQDKCLCALLALSCGTSKNEAGERHH